MNRRKNLVAIIGTVAVLVALTACDPSGVDQVPAPVVTSSPEGAATPTPPPEPVPTAARVSIDGDSILVTASDDSILVDIPFTTNVDAALGQLEGALGLAPTLSTLSGNGTCSAESHKAAWGSLVLEWGDSWSRAAGAVFTARGDGPDAASGVRITVPSGHSVGASEAEVRAAFPGAPGSTDSFSTIHYDIAGGVVGTSDYDSYGALAIFGSGQLKSIVSPIYYYYDC